MISNKLEQYFADDAATDALALLDSDPNSARDALLLVAGYIQRGEALPGDISFHRPSMCWYPEKMACISSG